MRRGGREKGSGRGIGGYVIACGCGVADDMTGRAFRGGRSDGVTMPLLGIWKIYDRSFGLTL